MFNFRNSFFDSIPPVTRNLLLINVVVWLVCGVIDRSGLVFGFLAMHSIGSDFYVYQLLTNMFVHLDFWHLFFNMFALYMFGRAMESYWGPKRYLIYYLITGVGAALIHLLICMFQPIPSISFGASGAVYGLLLAFGMTYPNMPIYLYFLFPIKAKYFALGFGVLELVYGLTNRVGDDVAHFAHLGGMLFGILLILYWRHEYKIQQWFKRCLSRLKTKKSKPTYSRQRETDYEYNYRKKLEQDEIDRILEKIKLSGYNALTENEKKTLFNAKK
ncbi:MAG: rhomboid family intramembrane serine protease [Candidatus Symbiothrix sp.]|jgi:membrane associated rhomboid family serine protease|nr:rhomboid family intramembrane serine protease [Candidatus Symbiothrix sp.]